MSEKLLMEEKGRHRGKVLEMVRAKSMTLKQAALTMGVCYRQAKRIYKRYREEGDKGLLHRSIGKPSHKRLDEAVKAKVLALYEEKYGDLGVTYAAEKLKECDGILIHHATLRRLLIKAGLWQSKRRRSIHRSRRERRPWFGQMVQFDGRHRYWFEQRRGSCCFMNRGDDAAGILLSFLLKQEPTEAALRLLWAWIERYGMTQADKEAAVAYMIQALMAERVGNRGIQVIAADALQSKGLVESNHGVYQDRFAKELPAPITAIEKSRRA